MIKATTPKEEKGTSTKAAQKVQKKKWDETLGQQRGFIIAALKPCEGGEYSIFKYGESLVFVSFYLLKKYASFHRKEFRRIAV